MGFCFMVLVAGIRLRPLWQIESGRSKGRNWQNYGWHIIPTTKERPHDLKVDQKAIRSNTLTNDDVKSYAEMTGDYNPLHFDAGFAAKRSRNWWCRDG